MTQLDKHTPGPWRTRLEDGYAFVSGYDWYDFARVVVRMDGDNEAKSEGLANLKLIRSAPEMLATLRAIAEVVADDERSGADRLDRIFQITHSWRTVTGYVITTSQGYWWSDKGWVTNKSMAKVYPKETIDMGLPIDGQWQPVYE